MKLKEINRTAIQAWSPAQQHPVYLAAGTSAQQLDATFSTSASLEIFELDLAEPTLSMKSCGTFSSSHRYHKLVWGPHGMDSQGHPSGVLIAGGENGSLILYDPAKIIAGDSDVIISQNDKHTGPVRALDVNPFQTNLVASGGNESEIYIWDLNNISSPMTPGPKTQPLEDISCVAWNRQVQHILASASPSGRASVWDLRKNDLIIKVSDHSNRMHCSGLAWNPEVATQLVLASEDDRMPVIQMWDLRFATSPLKVLENHTRGILAIAWSLADPELLLSCGKDNRILCWNPNTGEVLYELPTSTQWCFDIQWCPRNPAVLSAAAFDGHISIYSIMGGSNQNQIQQPVDQISASFGNMDPFGMGQALPPLQLPQSSAPQTTITPLKKPPKWIRRPVGASFAFGGKLVSWRTKLQATMTAGNFVDFCQSKIEAAQSEFERTLWSFLKVNFEDDTRGKYLELLGYKKEELALKIEAALQKEDITPEEPVSAPDAEPQPVPVLEPQPALQPISEPQPALDLQPGPELELKVDPIPEPQADVEPEPQLDLKPPVDLTSEPQLDLEPEAEPEVEPEIDLGSEEITNAEPALQEEEVNLNEMEEKEADEGEVCVEATDAINLKVTEGVDGLITEALLTGDFESAVELCLHDNRMADSIILAIAGGPELLEKTQKKYFEKTSSRITKLISAVVTNDWRDILETCDLQNWKEALAAVLTYASPEEFSALCDLLGSRLEADADLQPQACLCYVCAGNVEKLVACWARAQESHSPLSLQDLVEKVVVLRKAVEQTQGASPVVVGTLLAEKMSQYAGLLASQGSLLTAMAYLPENSDQVAIQLLQVGIQLYAEPWERRQPRPPCLPPQAPPSLPRPPNPPSRRPRWPPQPCRPMPQSSPPYPPPPQPTHVPTAPPQYYQQVRSASTITSWSNQTPTALPSIPAPVGPASDPQAPGQAEPAPRGLCCSPRPPPLCRPPAARDTRTPSSTPTLTPRSSITSLELGDQLSISLTTSFQHSGPGAPASYLPPPPTGPTGGMNGQDTAGFMEGPQNGWNDPPALSRVAKKKKVPENYTPPAPITAPIMAPLGDPQAQAQVQAPPTLQPQQLPTGQPGVQAPYPGLQQPLAPPPRQPTMPKANVEGAPGAPIGDIIQPVQAMPAEKITKKPIPEEHLVLKTTFEGLIQKCLAAATDPQTKRKLDDANKRLELLYDKLREKTLSPAIVGGLHSMARSIEARSYTDSLNIHTHIVSNSNFSETSAFMPVLKVVLTQANKLGV
ncbi:hypothetical protein ANANG_G00260900 [Anguilla anguilla]|uniref:Protein transport protein Sec31A n=1 Tax=Anguilla anguilla TaxID=7936 RepID=A0A9D3LP99_ANGAN|nr:hypothetical protein ANANG_G00260900 [Anguilla anguilla]